MKIEDSLEYINNRDYVIHVMSFMKIREQNLYDQIKNIMQKSLKKKFFGTQTDTICTDFTG